MLNMKELSENVRYAQRIFRELEYSSLTKSERRRLENMLGAVLDISRKRIEKEGVTS